ncbi:MAG: hypothetical protein ACI9BF_000305 [Candidatus Paceibacteria bacterium]|jgi:hypothetical protein
MAIRRETIKNSKATLICVAFLISTIVLYLYFLNMSVVQVVVRTEHTQRQNELNVEIAMLEASYIKAQHFISSRIATLEGYNTNTSKTYILREQSSLVFGGQQ